MAKVKIGGKEYTTEALRFKQLKRAFPLIQKSQKDIKAAQEEGREMDPIEGMETAIQIVAIALERTNSDMTAEKIEDEITLEECRQLQDTIVEIVTESGFEVSKPGEGAVAEGGASPSTETSTD
jgi:hypothetical protein